MEIKDYINMPKEALELIIKNLIRDREQIINEDFSPQRTMDLQRINTDITELTTIYFFVGE